MNNLDKFTDVVKLAVDRYDIQIHEIRFLAEETNILYKLTDVKGKNYLLKIFQEHSSTIEDNHMEVFVMDLVSRRSEISIPSIVTSKDGSSVQIIKVDEGSSPMRVIIYSWLEGEDLDGNENDERFIQLGEMTAQLHVATQSVKIPENFSPKRWDRIFYYKEDRSVYKNKEFQHFLSKEYHEIMDNMIPFLNNELLRYYQMNEENLQFIHSDLNPWNVLVSGDIMHIIDFEDVLWGLPLHDIAISLYYYRYEEELNYENVKRLFFKGYEKIRPLPQFEEYDLDLLMTARRVNFLNFILIASDDPSSFIEKSLPRVKEFIHKYKLKI